MLNSLHVSLDGDVATMAHSMIEHAALGDVKTCYEGDTRDVVAQLDDAPDDEDLGEGLNYEILVDNITEVLEGGCLQDDSGVAISLRTTKTTFDYGELDYLMESDHNHDN